MNPLQQLVQELAAAGVPPERMAETIQNLAREAERRRAGARSAGYSDSYLQGLSGPQLFGLQDTVSLLTGQEEVDRAERMAQEAALLQQYRAQTGGGMLDFTRQLEQDRIAQASDPFNIVGYLEQVAALPAGMGNTVQGLIGEGRYLSPSTPTYYDDSFNKLRSRLTDFGTPRTAAETVKETQQGQEAAARAQYGDAAIDRVAELRRLYGDQGAKDILSRLPKMAKGGAMTLTGPHFLMDMYGTPKALMGEEGPERMDITPIKRFATGGSINVNVPDNPYGKEIPGLTSSKPGTSQKGLDAYNRTGGKGGGSSLDLAYRMRAGTGLGGSKSLGGKRLPRFSLLPPQMPQQAQTAPAQGEVTSPRQAAAMALAKALKLNPFAPAELIAALERGEPVPPGAFTQRFRNNVDPVLLQALMGINQAFGFRPDSYMAQAQQYDVPGFTLYA